MRYNFITETAMVAGLVSMANATAHIATPVSVRLPPTLSNGQGSNWKNMPLGWDFGNWFQTNSSSANAFQRNLQYSTLPIIPNEPEGQRSDLSSFQLATNDTVYTSYGVDTPTAIPSVYRYQGTGILKDATDLLEVLAWGVDGHGVPYRVSYSTETAATKTPASIDVLSRKKSGVDATTLKKIQSALVALGNDEVTALANKMGPAIQDNGRDGMPPILECDDYCKSNEDLIGLF